MRAQIFFVRRFFQRRKVDFFLEIYKNDVIIIIMNTVDGFHRRPIPFVVRFSF